MVATPPATCAVRVKFRPTQLLSNVSVQRASLPLFAVTVYALAAAGISFSLHCEWFKGPSHSKNLQHFLCQCDEPLKNRRRLSHTKRRPQEREQVHVHAQREADDATYIGRRRRQVYGIPGSGKQRHHLLEQFRQSRRTKRLFK